jgi:hypothetical protein
MPLREAGPPGPSLLVKRLLDRYGAFSVDCRDVSPNGGLGMIKRIESYRGLGSDL